MEYKVVMKNSVYDMVQELMRNIETLNKGNEVGGWLTGEWTFEGETATLLLDKFIIPKQTVSGSEVDISPESMADMLKEFGPEECNRLKAHWHIHPFGKGKTNWSSIDEDKIKDWMAPEKGREIFVFLLSSEDTIKARVLLNCETRLKRFDKTFNYRADKDDIEVLREEATMPKYLDELKARIDEKVSEKPYSSVTYCGETWKKGYSQKSVVVEDGFRCSKQKDRVFVEMTLELYEQAMADGIFTEGFLPDATKEKGANRMRLMYYMVKDQQDDFIKDISYQLRMLERDYKDAALDDFDQRNLPGYLGYTGDGIAHYYC